MFGTQQGCKTELTDNLSTGVDIKLNVIHCGYFGGYERYCGCMLHSEYSAEGKQVICCSEGKLLSLQTPIFLLWHFLSTVCVAFLLYCPHFSHSSGTRCVWN